MKKNTIFIIGLIVCLCETTSIFAQGNFTANHLQSIPGRPGYARGMGMVTIRLGELTVYCDYAEFNQHTSACEAHGNLRIKTRDGGIMTGKTLSRPPNNPLITINQDVFFIDKDSTKLYTDRAVYNSKTEIFTYTTGGKIVNDSTVLTSKIGHYHNKTKAFHCKTNVVIEDPNYTIHTDTLQLRDNVAYFYSPTHVWSDSNYLYCEDGWYKTKEKTASLTQNAFIQTNEQKMFGDSIYYEMANDFGMAFEHVTVVDSLRDLIIHCDLAFSNRKKGDAWFTKNAVGIVISEKDSLFLRGDTLRIAYDSNENVKHLLAYYKVKFFRHDLQGACDSLAYVMQDSTLTMFGTPIAWANRDQLSGDTIRVRLANNRPKQMWLENQAFIVSKGFHDGHFNQIKGHDANGFFNDSSDLEWIRVTENVETIYFVTDDIDSSLIGILKVNGEQMEMTLENRAIVRINYFKPEDGAMFPEHELPLKDRLLQGFYWETARRPKSKTDISERL